LLYTNMLTIIDHRHIYTGLFWIFFLSIPFWIQHALWYHFLIVYMIYWFFGDVVMSLFLHRWAAHSLWNPPVWIQNSLAFLGVLILQGTPISWAAWHRTHHAHTDTERDPHSPKYKSIFYIVCMHHFHDADYRRGIDRARNKWFFWLNNHQGKIAITASLVLFLLLPLHWFLTVWAVPIALLNIVPDLTTNVLCHSKGIVKNRPWLWPLVFREVYHKSHHDNLKLTYAGWDPAVSLITILGWSKN
jgi:fatty-acid desaturase